jgi:type IV pilus assembly protein PilO
VATTDLIEKFGKASSRQKLIGVVLISVIIGAVFYFMFYSDVSQQADRMDKRIKTALQEKESYLDKQRRYNAFRAEVTKLIDEQRELLKVLPTDAEIPSFLQSIHAQGELSGLNILNFEQQAEQPANFYATIPVKMEILGSYFQINKFFYSIGQLKRIVNVRDLKLTTPTATEAGVVLKAEFVASTFRFLQPAPSAAPGATPPAGTTPPAGKPQG